MLVINPTMNTRHEQNNYSRKSVVVVCYLSKGKAQKRKTIDKVELEPKGPTWLELNPVSVA